MLVNEVYGHSAKMKETCIDADECRILKAIKRMTETDMQSGLNEDV